jgi:hypothetical protein
MRGGLAVGQQLRAEVSPPLQVAPSHVMFENVHFCYPTRCVPRVTLLCATFPTHSPKKSADNSTPFWSLCVEQIRS